MKHLKKINCFCNNKKPKIFIKGNKYNINLCKNCKLIYADTYLEENDSKRLYEHKSDIIKINNSPIAIDDCIKRIKDIEKITRRKGTILDFGTGDSNFLHIAKKRGWTVYGYDLNTKIAKIQKKNGINMLEKSEIKNNFFDVITMFHVLEHIPDPNNALKFLHKKIKRKGLLVIDVPNGNALEIKLFKGKSTYIDLKDKNHLYYYSMKTLSDILKKNKFKPIKKEYKGGFAMGQIARLKKKVTGDIRVEQIYQNAKPLAKIFKMVCKILRITDCIQIISQKQTEK